MFKPAFAFTWNIVWDDIPLNTRNEDLSEAILCFCDGLEAWLEGKA